MSDRFRSTTVPPAPPLRLSAVDASHSPAEVSDAERLLRDAVKCADAHAQDGLSRIASLARLVLAGLESAGPLVSQEDIARVFITIEELAERTEELISMEADRVGCRYVDEAAGRRSDAREAQRARRVPT